MNDYVDGVSSIICNFLVYSELMQTGQTFSCKFFSFSISLELALVIPMHSVQLIGIVTRKLGIFGKNAHDR